MDDMAKTRRTTIVIPAEDERALRAASRAEGVSQLSYQRRFGRSMIDDLPQLAELSELGLAVEIDGCLRLNEEGIAWTDTIGPWLYSDAVTERMNAYELA